MKKLIVSLFLITFLGTYAQEKINLNYYLSQDVSYNEAIPTPESVIGHQVGEWHISHDKLVHYMQTLAASSDRITIETKGKTYEDRPILLLTITSPQNHQNLENIRQEHLKLSDASSTRVNVKDMPVVVYQGFSIHGNEPSGSNAALLVAYYLAAAQGNEIDELLSNTVILFDPSFNPDGLNRFANWANIHKNKNITSDSNDREYDEVWPGGRTNHYWFDMNRDWLVTQLPESQARIKTFHKWKPNILTDHHEMGTNSTFFFQPGIPSRTHPLTPKLNQQLTAKIGEFHAKALDKIGSLYFTEERYDDFYYGKGSTFPDINGGIGILFEQASSRGHAQDTDNGLLTFPFTIRNQFTTALSTLEAGNSMREELLTYQYNFYKNAQQEVSKDRNKGIIFGDAHDKGKTYQFAKMLERQHIKFHKLNEDVNANGTKFTADGSYIIPTNQPNYRMIKGMFEVRTKFQDSLFYDVSAWTLPMAFDLDYGYTRSTAAAGEVVSTLKFPEGKVNGKSDYAYLFEWDEYYTPKALYAILKYGLRAKVATKPFGIGGKNYDYGSILVPVANQEKTSAEIYALLQQLAKETGVDFNGVNTGIASGIDLGSSYFRILEQPKIAVLVGEGIRSYDAGEIWHLLDTRYQIPITKLDTKDINRADLSNYTTVIMASTSGRTIDKNATENLKTFVKNGGILIGYRDALRWLDNKKFLKLDFKKSKVEAKDVSFAERADFRGAQVIGGAIFEADIDLTHPVGYGYNDDKIALFRNTTLFIKPDSTSNYKNPLQYTKKALLSGYISKENLKTIKGTLPFKTQGMGRGQVVAFTDNTNFRAFWYGTNKLLMNAIFFGKMM